MKSWFSTLWGQYFLAVLITSVGLLANMGTRELMGNRMVLIFLFPAIVFVALLGGRGPAILATVLSVLATIALRVQPLDGAAQFLASDLIALTAFTLACAMIVAFADRVRAADARFRVLADSAPVLVWAVDAAKAGAWFNHEWLRFRGRTLKQEMGGDWTDGIHPDDVAVTRATFDAAFQRREPFTIEYRLQRHDGEFRRLLDHGVPLHEGTRGSFSGFIGSCIDITAQKLAEQQMASLLEREREARREGERISQMKDEFLATLSHEVRTPLNAIVGWAHLLRADPSPEKMARGIEVIDRNARVQKQIIDDLLDMSRIMAGKVQMDVQPVDLRTVIDSAIASVQPAADARRIRIDRALDADVGATSGDPGRLQQVVWNLLTNAVKFTPEGGHVEVSLRRVDSHAELAVKDSGIGIKPNFLPHVFERFRQGDASTTREHGGLGLGLSISKQLTELHGGAIRAESPGAGQGSTFIVSLPLYAGRHLEGAKLAFDREALSPGVPKSVQGLKTPSLIGLFVLVAEDEPDARELVGMHLRSAGARVELVRSAQGALQAISEQTFDVLISDIGMPYEDGYTLIQKIRALPPAQGGTVPALALTAFARSEDRRRAILSGYHMHLAKPVDPLELVTMVAGLAGRHGRAAAVAAVESSNDNASQ